MGCAATVKLDGNVVPAGVAANDNAVPGGRVAWYRNYHRYYDPAVGRYTQVDPASTGGASPDGDRVGPYVYAENNPAFFGDPSGLYPDLPDWAWRLYRPQQRFVRRALAYLGEPTCECFLNICKPLRDITDTLLPVPGVLGCGESYIWPTSRGTTMIYTGCSFPAAMQQPDGYKWLSGLLAEAFAMEYCGVSRGDPNLAYWSSACGASPAWQKRQLYKWLHCPCPR